MVLDLLYSIQGLLRFMIHPDHQAHQNTSFFLIYERASDKFAEM